MPRNGMSFDKVTFYTPGPTSDVPISGGVDLPLYYPDMGVQEQYVKLNHLDMFREYNSSIKGLAKPVIEFDDIKGETVYDDGALNLENYNKFNWFLRSNKGIHQGQRKLLISEMQALNNTFTNADDKGLVIYVGSAPSMKLRTMMDMYPNVKFLLIDPNEFFIYTYRYDLPHYVLQDDTFIEDGYKWGAPQSTDERRADSNDCVYLSVSASDMYTSRFYKRKNVLYYNTDSDSLTKMKKPITKSKYGEGSRNLTTGTGEFPMLSKRANRKSIEYVFSSDHRVYFVEEYFTNDLAAIIGEVSARYPDVKTTFWSDVRTSFTDESGISDFDIILNTAWTYSWLRLLKPNTSMLKWRLPFFNEAKEIDFSGHKESFDDAASRGYDFRVPTWETGTFKFFPGRIMLQAWCGPESKETRLLVNHEDIINNNLIDYSIKDYENRINWYNYIDRFSIMHENPNADSGIGFCHCNDCAIENSVWMEYCAKVKTCDIGTMIARVSSLLHINLIGRGGVFGHGHLFPSLTMTEFIKKVTESRYPNVDPLRH